MSKQPNVAGDTCHRCKTYCGPLMGWRWYQAVVGYVVMHNSCYNSYLEDNKIKLKKGFKEIDKHIKQKVKNEKSIDDS